MKSVGHHTFIHIMLTIALTVAACAAAGAPREINGQRLSQGCGRAAPKAPATNLMVSGQQRQFILVVSQDYHIRQPQRLVFAFHGRTDNNAKVRGYYDLEHHAVQPTLFVYPSGLKDQSGRFTWSAPRDRADALRDYAFFDALLADIGKRYCVALSRLYCRTFSGCLVQQQLGMRSRGSSSRRGHGRRRHLSQRLPRCRSRHDRPQSQGSPRAICRRPASSRYVFEAQWLAGSSRGAASRPPFELPPLWQPSGAQSSVLVPAYARSHLGRQVLPAQLATGYGAVHHGVFRFTAVRVLHHAFSTKKADLLMETTSFNLATAQQDLLQSLSQETGKPISVLIEEALNRLREDVRLLNRSTNGNDTENGGATYPSSAQPRKPIWEFFEEASHNIPDEELDRLPTDGSYQHDHHLYGTPKRPT